MWNLKLAPTAAADGSDRSRPVAARWSCRIRGEVIAPAASTTALASQLVPSAQTTPVITAAIFDLVGERDHLLVGEQREIRRVADRVDQIPFGIRLVAAGRRIAVEVLGLLLVVQNLPLEAERQRLRLPGAVGGGDPVEERLQLRLVVEAVDAEELLRLVIVGSEFVIADRPAEALVRLVRPKLVRCEAQQRRAVPLRLAADVVELAGDEHLVVAVDPLFLVLEAAFLEHLFDVEGRPVARQRRALLQQKNTLSAPHQLVGDRRATGAGTDNDRVVDVAHRRPPYLGCLVIRGSRRGGLHGVRGRFVPAMDATVRRVVIELGAELLTAELPQPKHLDGQLHSDDRGGEVDPQIPPEMRRQRRGEAARRVDAHA